MAVHVTVPAVLRRYAAGEEEASVPGATVGEALEGLFRVHPDLRTRVLDRKGAVHPYLLLFRNDEELPREGLLDRTLADGDSLEIVGAAEGG